MCKVSGTIVTVMNLNYIVMDLEFNQSFDFKDGTKAVVEPACSFEIIQIGLVKLGADFNILETLELNIRPTLYKRIHPFVAKITGITHRDIYSGAQTFPQSFDRICSLIGSPDNIFVVWGGTDVNLLFRNINYHKLSISGIPVKYIDVQALASRRLNTKSGTSVGLKNAVSALEIEQDEPFHNALSDALYTTKVLDVLRGSEPNMEKHIKTFGYPSGGGVSKRKMKALSYNIVALYREAEKMFGHKLSTSQKKIVKNIYEMGMENKFK